MRISLYCSSFKEEKLKRGLRYDFDLLALLLIPVGVALNFVGYQLSAALKLPVWIDQVGTCFVSMIAD